MTSKILTQSEYVGDTVRAMEASEARVQELEVSINYLLKPPRSAAP